MTGHTCPGGCGRPVPAHQYACRSCWYRLPAAIRAAIWAGYRAAPLGDQHRAAMADARDWYRQQASDTTDGDQPGPSREQTADRQGRGPSC